MNAKINLLGIVFICFFSCGLIGCGNSSNKQQAESAYPLKEIFNKIYAEAVEDYKRTAKDDARPLERYGLDIDTVHKMLQDSIVKNQLIYSKSQAYYDMILNRFFYDMNSTFAYIQNDGKYFILLYEDYGHVRVNMPGSVLTYNPDTDKLDIETTIDGRVVQSDGEIYYNTEGWELKYNKDEFDEDIKSQPMAYYSLMADYDLVPYADIWIGAFWNGVILLCTNDFGYSSISIDKILIKDNDSGKIYNLAFNDKYHQAGGGAMYDDIGVVMWGENATQFMNIVTSLTDYSISFINESGENRVVKNPKNLCNIEDAIKKFIVNNTNE